MSTKIEFGGVSYHWDENRKCYIDESGRVIASENFEAEKQRVARVILDNAIERIAKSLGNR